MAKTSYVALAIKDGETTQKFDVIHAERILALPNSAWRLADENYEIADNGTIVRRNKKGDKRAKAQD